MAEGSIDNIIEPGTYLISNALGLPENSYAYGVLLVCRIPVGTTAIQMYITDTPSPNMYVRQRWNNGPWRGWSRLQNV